MLVEELIAKLSDINIFPRNAEIRIDNGDYSSAFGQMFYVKETHRVYIMPEPAVHITGRK